MRDGTLPRVAFPPIEQLDTQVHDRAHFYSGEDSLDRWLRENAGQAARGDGAKTYVTCDDQARIVGFYSLCAFQIESTEVPKGLRMGGYPVPAVLLARLAVDASQQGEGLGGYLLLDALQVAALVSEQIGARILVVHALHERAAEYYLQHGFARTESDARCLYLPMKDIRATLAQASLP